jgi:hypothetical protein
MYFRTDTQIILTQKFNSCNEYLHCYSPRKHFKYAKIICDTIESSVLLRGTGIAKRTPDYILKK